MSEKIVPDNLQDYSLSGFRRKATDSLRNFEARLREIEKRLDKIEKQ